MAQTANGEAAATDEASDVKWLALLVRQGLKVIVAGIDAKYGESRSERERRERCQRADRQDQRAA